MRTGSDPANPVKRALGRLVSIAAAMLLSGLLWAAASWAQSTEGSPATSSLIVKLAAGLSASDQAAVIARNGGVEKSTVPALRLHVVEMDTNQLEHVLASYRADPQVVRAEENKTRKSEAMPSDPLYPNQWALPKINWDLVFGNAGPSAAVVVAVLDTGIDSTHPDLGANVVPGISMLDGSNGLTDPSGHGTRVAGIVAARTHTQPAEGIAGVGYAGIRVMPVTVLNANGLGQDSDVIAGVIWAADHDADVILMAFSHPSFSESLQEAIDYAWSKDVVLVAAGGNDGFGSPTYPAGDRGVIGVASTDTNDQLASFSNYGQSIFLAAPGTDILTTDLGGGYSMTSGTSSSAAMVAGAAAQLWAIDPTLSNGIIVGRLARSADPAGTRLQTGNGRLNLAGALVDTGTEFIMPAGAAPVGEGGPFVGPYEAAARAVTITFAGTGAGQVQIGASSGAVSYATTGGNRCDTPPASATGNNTSLVTINGSCASLSSSNNGATVAVTAAANGTSFFAGWSNANGSFTACNLGNATCSQVLAGGQNNLTVTFTLKQTVTASVTAANKTYDATATATVSACTLSGVQPADAADVICTAGGATFADATSGVGKTVTATGIALSGAKAFKYVLASTTATTTANIDKASSATTVTFEAGPYAYRGTAFTATANVTGIGALDSSVQVVYSGDCTTVTSTNGCTATATFAGDVNHEGSSDSKSITIVKAGSTTTVAFEAGPYAYRGTPFTATATVTGAGGLNTPVSVTYSGDCTNVTGANGCTATGTFAGDANHEGSSDSKSITIVKSSSMTTVTFEAGPYTYRGTAFTATATVTGAGGLNTSSPVTYSGDCTNVTSANGCTATATFAGDANHEGSSDSTSITIVKAGSTTTVAFEAGPYTYRGTAFTATATVTGAGGLNTSSPVTYSGDCTNVTSANGCTATATFSGDANHTGSSDTKSITIVKAGSTTTVTFEAGPYTYRGTAFTATATVTGAGGLNTSVPVTYSGDCTNVTSANGCTATSTFAGDANHEGSSDSKSITIVKASSTTTVTFEAGPYTYRGTAFTATAVATGVGGLNAPVAVVYGGDCTNVTSANGCTATATFAGDANHTGSSDTKSITIVKASSTTTVTFEVGPYAFRGTAFTATAAVTGTGGLDSPVPVVYSGDCTNVTSANGCTATATFAGDANHEGSGDSKSITITKASSATAVSCPASLTYDGSPLTPCTAVVTGVGGLSQPLTVVYANNTNAGTATASASFAGDANHTGSSDSTSFTIDKAGSTTVVTVAGGESFTYDGVAHPATVLVMGAGGLSLAPAPIYGCGHVPVDVADSGCTASYAYPGDANHTGSADAKTYAIGRRSAAVTPNSASKFLGNGDPVPLTSGTLTGFVDSDGIAATYARTPGETLAGSPYTIGATLSPAAKLANYDIAYNTASFHILAVSVTGPAGPLAKGSPATVGVGFPSSGTQAGPVCTFDWDDGTTSAVAATNAGGSWTCTLARTYAAAGVYEVEVTVTDANTGSTMVAFQYVVIYDASAGFVTGGGWINSPPGAFVGTSLTGKANFGFVSKYKNGQSVPSGETEFQFKAGGFNFHSTVYDWLVIAGAKAQYKGSGKVNDAGDYGFLLTATDGKANGGGGVDKFRIKIWDMATGAIVYDNNLGASDDIDSANPQALGGGSITIHK